jgi:opacity protein-like surface antigen
MKKASAILSTVLLLAAVALAADVSGTWNATVDLGGGQGGTPTFTLKQDGDKLTGTYSGALGEAPIHGTIKGSDVAFDFDVQGAAVHYAGKLEADGKTIKGTCDYGGQASGTFSATRSDAKK